jgi:hypothetical protein
MATHEGYYSCTEYVCHDHGNFWKGNLIEHALLQQTDKLLQSKLDAKFIPKLWSLSGASKQQIVFGRQKNAGISDFMSLAACMQTSPPRCDSTTRIFTRVLTEIRPDYTASHSIMQDSSLTQITDDNLIR